MDSVEPKANSAAALVTFLTASAAMLAGNAISRLGAWTGEKARGTESNAN